MSRPNPFSSGRSKPHRIFTSYFINSKLIKPRSGFSILHHYSLQALNCSAVLSIFSTSFFYRFLKFFSIVFVRKYSSVISFMLPTCRVKGNENQLILNFFFTEERNSKSVEYTATMAKLILSSFYGLLFSAMTFTPVGESIISLGDYESSRNEYSLH